MVSVIGPEDDEPGYNALGEIASEIMSAVKSGSHEDLESALSALCDHIQSEDKELDQEQE